MKRRLISFLLVFCMLFSILPMQVLAAEVPSAPQAQTQNPFTDVQNTDWFFDAVQYARINGFFSGTSNTDFTPNGTMTRGMFVTVLGRMAGVNPEEYDKNTGFSDVLETMYYAPYVKWAATYGITSGTGNGTFSPNANINREQMATFFVRYFETFAVDYQTNAGITGLPEDFDTISAFAQDSVQKLWKTGLLNGDGVNFNPTANATRAQAAALCMRTDDAVKTWYSKPGVPSERVKINLNDIKNPAKEDNSNTSTEQNTQKPNSNSSGGSHSGGSSSGGSSTSYYEVKFAAVDGQDMEDVILPDKNTYANGTEISSLPTPVKKGGIFLGWYYDAAGENAVLSTDKITRNLTLYAKIATGDEVSGVETPNYVTVVEQPTTFSFQVVGADNEQTVKDALTLMHVTGGNLKMAYTISGNGNPWTITADYEQGQTYQAELTNDSIRFVVNGNEQDSHVRYLNILTEKQEVANFNMNRGLKYIPKKDVSGLAGGAYNGLFSADVNSERSVENTTTGTFTYEGNELTLELGDTVAIYEGIRPDERNLLNASDDEGDIAYVMITGIEGNSYTYEMADVENILQLPDVLPISISADQDEIDKQITVSAIDVNTALTAVDAAAVDIGDFIAFYNGEYTGETTNIVDYAEITGVLNGDEQYVITYEDASEADMQSALDVYYTREEAIELSDEEAAALETDIQKQVQESGYVEEASRYLAAYALETDGFTEVPEDIDINARMQTMGDVVATAYGGVMRKEDDVKVEFDWRKVSVRQFSNIKLDHLQGRGIDVEVKIPFEVTIKNKTKIQVTASFEEEILLKTSIGTSRIKTGFLKYDYALNVGFDVGNYTGVNFTATVTAAQNENNESMTKELDEIIDIMQAQLDGGRVDVSDGTLDTLADTYSNLMDGANDTWIELINEKIFKKDGSAYLHIFCWEVGANFIVSANVNVSMGMDFAYINQKRYNFSVRVKARTSTNQTIDVIEAQYSFNFYVIGTVGIRAGIRLEMYVGLFTLKLDKIGITAETGIYAQLWGYFYYHLDWKKSTGRNQNYSGAMLIELGCYLEIKFVAQAFSSNKLTWNPTIYSHQWPFWSAGAAKNVYDFAQGDTDYAMKKVKTLSLPSDTFLMKYMSMKNGKISTVNQDDAQESKFIISFSNDRFQYNARTNTVTVTPAAGSLEENTEMTIIWKSAPLAFTAKPIRKVLNLSWTDPEGARYLSFDSQGGSAVDTISAGSGAAIIWPENPTKTGYTFAGWYTDAQYTGNAYTPVSTMPIFEQNQQGVTLYAKWTPAAADYTVEYYQKELNGTYTLVNTETKTGISENLTATDFYNPYVGFVLQPVEQKVIAADGSTVVQVYFDREQYTVTFADGTDKNETITQTYLFGDELQAPVFSREGYAFIGWDRELPKTVTGNAVYTAQWEETIVSYTVEHYQQNVENDDYILANTSTLNGMVGTETAAAAKIYEGFTAQDFAQETIAEDGSTVVKIYYNRNLYPVAWEANGSELTGDYTSGEVKFGTTIVAPDSPTKTDYQFNGWYTDAALTTKLGDDTTVPVGGLTLYAEWLLENNAVYTVKHYQQNVENDAYTLTDTEKTSGPIGQETTAAAKTYEGFTAQDFAQETIAEDGSTVVEIKYDRNLYSILWMTGYGDFSDAQGFTAGLVKFGTTIVAPVLTEKGYVMTGWYIDEELTTKLKDNATVPVGGLTLHAKWEPGVAYTVEHYQQNIENDDYTLVRTETRNGAVGRETDAAANTYEGFTAQDFAQETIAEDGSTVVEIKYDRNLYSVNWEIDDGKALTGNYTNGAVKFGTTIVTPNRPTKSGYLFSGWYTDETFDTRFEDGMTVPVDGLTLYVKWAEATGTLYDIWVADVQVTSENADNILPNGNNDGKVSYDAATNTLTLQDANISANIGQESAVIYSNLKLIINVQGTNTVTNTYQNARTETEEICGIWVASVHTTPTFIGNGTLTVTTADNAQGKNIAIHAGSSPASDVAIQGPVIHAYAGTGTKSYGVMTHVGVMGYPIYLYEGTLYAKGHTAAVLCGTSGINGKGDAALTFDAVSKSYDGELTETEETTTSENCAKYQSIKVSYSNTTDNT